MTAVFVLVSVFVIPALYLLAGLQVICLAEFIKGGFKGRLSLLLDLSRYRLYPEFFMALMLMALLTLISFLFNVLKGSRSGAFGRKRRLSLQEKRESSRLSGVFEAKKGTIRLEFDAKGRSLEGRSFLGRMDFLTDGVKRAWQRG